MKVKADIVTSDDIKNYFTGKFQDSTAWYIIKTYLSIFIFADTTSLSINTVIGHVVFSVLVTDTENDQIYYSLSCTPAGCPFTIHACKH